MSTTTAPSEQVGIVVAIEGSTLKMVATDIAEKDANEIIQDLQSRDIDSAFFPVPAGNANQVLESLNASHVLERLLN